MSNAHWLILAVPKWYFTSLTEPFAGRLLTVVPAIGSLCLLVGLMIGAIRPNWRLTIFVLPFMLTEALAAVAGFYRGEDGAFANYASNATLLVSAVVSIFGIYICKNARIAASLLCVFSVTYCLFGVFVADMSFSNDWL